MAETAPTPAPVTAPKPPAPKPASAASFTPWAWRGLKLRDGIVKFIADLKPEGNPDPAQVARAKAHVTATIESFPPEFNAFEIVIEGNRLVNADQVTVIVWPKTL